MLKILNMGDKNSFFFFMDELYGLTKLKLRRRGVRAFASVIVIIKSFIDYVIERKNAKVKDKKDDHSNGEGDHNKLQGKGDYGKCHRGLFIKVATLCLRLITSANNLTLSQ